MGGARAGPTCTRAHRATGRHQGQPGRWKAPRSSPASGRFRSCCNVGRAAGELARRTGQPVVLGALAAGVLLGPSALDASLPDVQHALFTGEQTARRSPHCRRPYSPANPVGPRRRQVAETPRARGAREGARQPEPATTDPVGSYSQAAGYPEQVVPVRSDEVGVDLVAGQAVERPVVGGAGGAPEAGGADVGQSRAELVAEQPPGASRHLGVRTGEPRQAPVERSFSLRPWLGTCSGRPRRAGRAATGRWCG